MSDQDLSTNVLQWLHKQGFPLELKVAKAFQVKKFNVIQSSYYADFEEGKPRETDVIARLYSHHEPIEADYICELETYAVIECKSSDKPWVVFRGTPMPYWQTDSFLTNRAGKGLVDRAKLKAGHTSILVSHSIAGYSAAMAFTDEGRAFSAMMSAMKAAEFTYKKRIEADKEIDASGSNPYIPMVHAVVVTTSPIFECTVNEQYQMELRSVPRSAVALQYPRNRPDSNDSLIIHIVSETALEGFVNEISLCHSELANGLKDITPREGA